jgi:hypothetical protein
MCQGGNCPFSLLKEPTEIETGRAEKSSWDQANRRQKHGLVRELERTLANLSKTTFTYRSLLTYFMVSAFQRVSKRRVEKVVFVYLI